MNFANEFKKVFSDESSDKEYSIITRTVPAKAEWIALRADMVSRVAKLEEEFKILMHLRDKFWVLVKDELGLGHFTYNEKKKCIEVHQEVKVMDDDDE